MDVTKILLGTIVGAIVMFFSGWLIWGFGLHNFQTANTVQYEGLVKEMPSLGITFAAMIATALLWSIIFNRWAGIKTFATGAKAGAMIAILTGLSTGFMNMSMMNLWTWPIVLSDLGGNLIWGAISGGVIGFILGRGQN